MSKARSIEITIDGRSVHTPAHVSVAAAMLNAGVTAFRSSVSGEARAPLCGMGVCWDCRVTIDGRAHVRACMVQVAPGMVVSTTSHDG